MEQDIAILIADLSGYTALTEAHGAMAAADLIDKYIDLVEQSVVGDSVLHERVGDEVVIVSNTPTDLLCTATMLLKRSQEENYFLQLHGGLHYGPVLKRNSHFFGSTINIASRIAAQAPAGSFWCSGIFLQTIKGSSSITFTNKGKIKLKNVADEIELFELLASEQQLYVDPVCRMLLKQKEEAIAHPTEKELFFCSENCLQTYLFERTVEKP